MSARHAELGDCAAELPDVVASVAPGAVHDFEACRGDLIMMADHLWVRPFNAEQAERARRKLGLPMMPNIDAAILAASDHGARLDMTVWHRPCGTAHCRAGWAVIVAGSAGLALERVVGTPFAALLIYAVSRPGRDAPRFNVTDEEALADLRECAAGAAP